MTLWIKPLEKKTKTCADLIEADEKTNIPVLA